MGATVGAGGDAPPIFQAREHDLDFVALAIKDSIGGERDFTVFEGMQGVIPFLARAAWNQSAS